MAGNAVKQIFEPLSKFVESEIESALKPPQAICETLCTTKMTINFENILAESFDTYKAFRDLKVKDVGIRLEGSPKTIWQIINHLILWQKHQLNILTEGDQHKQFWEIDSWIEDKQPNTQLDLDKAVETFNEQIIQFKLEIKRIRITDLFLEQKLKAVHEAATHLSFHLGEIIHLRRILGEYPMPDQMKGFLNNK